MRVFKVLLDWMCARGSGGAGGDEIREGLSENWGKRKFKNEVSILVFHLGKIKEQREISLMLTLTLGTFDSLTIITLRQVSVHKQILAQALRFC